MLCCLESPHSVVDDQPADHQHPMGKTFDVCDFSDKAVNHHFDGLPTPVLVGALSGQLRG